MRTPRFFVPFPIPPDGAGRSIALPEAAAHHALRVLRLREGDPIALFDGHGGEWAATLVDAQRREARARLDHHDAVERESPRPLVLAQATIASDPMELVVRKAVELGACAVEPVIAARSQGGASLAKRTAHWRAIAVAACEQCGRNRVPAVADPLPFVDWLRGDGAADACMLVPGSDASLAEVCRRRPPGVLIVGPEGGWTDDEVRAARERGVEVAHLGPRVLRAETAAIAALAIAGAPA